MFHYLYIAARAALIFLSSPVGLRRLVREFVFFEDFNATIEGTVLSPSEQGYLFWLFLQVNIAYVLDLLFFWVTGRMTTKGWSTFDLYFHHMYLMLFPTILVGIMGSISVTVGTSGWLLADPGRLLQSTWRTCCVVNLTCLNEAFWVSINFVPEHRLRLLHTLRIICVLPILT